VWAVLHRYRTAYEDPACPPTLRADHDRVAEEALRLVERATGAHPISPLDSVACHAALRDLAAGAGVLEQTVAALRGVPDVRAPEPAAGGRRTAAGADAPQPVEVPGVTGSTAPSGVHGHDFFASAAPSRGFEFRLSLRGSRGLKRSRQLAGDGPTEPPAAD